MVQEGKDYVQGKWSIPGGGIEHGEDPVDAVKREVEEETGLKPEVEKLLAVLTGEDDGDGHPAFVFVFKAKVGSEEPEPVQSKEILDVDFVSREEIEDLDLRNDEIMKAIDAEEKGYSLDIGAFDKFVNL